MRSKRRERDRSLAIDQAPTDDPGEHASAAKLDAHLSDGELVTIRKEADFHIGGVPLPHEPAFACMAETLLLGLMGVRENFSYGPIEPSKVRQVMAWAGINGFALGEDKTQASY